jgi:NTP pyrophosphatase (non-canonical NTP hydrolase)
MQPFEYMMVANAARQVQDTCHDLAKTSGWWTDLVTGADITAGQIPRSIICEKLLLIHSEISEATEGLRKNLPDDKLPHRPMIEVELADAVIRIFDLAGAMEIDLPGAIAEKLQYNSQRTDHKIENRKLAGGKTF